MHRCLSSATACLRNDRLSVGLTIQGLVRHGVKYATAVHNLLFRLGLAVFCDVNLEHRLLNPYETPRWRPEQQ